MNSRTLPAEVTRKLSEQDFEIYSLREMMNRLQEGIYITDHRGITLYVNTAFLHLSGLSREDLVGKRVHDMRDEGVLPNSCCARVIESRKPVTTINNYYQGQKCLVSGSPIFDTEGNLIRTVAIVRDVSELDAMMESLSREELGWKTEQNLIENKDRKKAQAARNSYTLPESDDPLMQEIYGKAERMADLDSTLLIVGETGTGKDFLASAIHEIRSRRKGGELVRINCGAIPEHLIESELFGYEKGAFTGAAPEGRKGLLEVAGEGTVFLDEIGEMPYLLQVKLLNVLNDRQFYRVGGNKMIDFKARVIATTNANLGELVKHKKFRADLFFRLNVFRISVPPLRRRQSEIIPLLNLFLHQFNTTYGKNHMLSAEALHLLKDYPWPGNIRELKSFIEKSVVFSTGIPMSGAEVIPLLPSEGSAVDDIPTLPQKEEVESLQLQDRENSGNPRESRNLKIRMKQYERGILEETISRCRTLGDAAELLEIDLSTLMRKKKSLGIQL